MDFQFLSHDDVSGKSSSIEGVARKDDRRVKLVNSILVLRIINGEGGSSGSIIVKAELSSLTP